MTMQRPLPYHVEALASVETLLVARLRELLSLHQQWATGVARQTLLVKEEAIRRGQALLRKDLRGLVGAVRLIRDARRAHTLPKAKHPTDMEERAQLALAVLHANARGWVEYGGARRRARAGAERDFGPDAVITVVEFHLPAGRFERAGGRF